MVKDGLNLVDIALIFIELHQYQKPISGFSMYDLNLQQHKFDVHRFNMY